MLHWAAQRRCRERADIPLAFRSPADTLAIHNVITSTLSDSISIRCRKDSGLFLIGEILGDLSSSMMTGLNGGNEVGLGFDFARQLVAHDVDEVVAGEQIGSLAVG